MNNFWHLTNIIWCDYHPATVYGIAWNGSVAAGYTPLRVIALVVLGIILACMLVSPAHATIPAEVTSIPECKDTLAQDNPEFIGPLKTHVAYVGQDQDARMEGVILYIDTISNGDGSTRLREIHEDYMAVASSIPVMQTFDDISEARIELQRQSRLFNEETKLQIVTFNGSIDTMREKTRESMQSAEDSLTNLTDYLWLAKESARLTTFNRESDERAIMIRSLSIQGVDISKAEAISQQIDAQRSVLQDALMKKSVPALKSGNNGLISLKKEFRSTMEVYRSGLMIEMKRAAILEK